MPPPTLLVAQNLHRFAKSAKFEDRKVI